MDDPISTQLNLIINDLAIICTKKALKIATAESCTGGGVAYELTSLPGSSHWFERGFVTYSNLAKIQMLGVDQDTINQYGAVSQEVARQMAEGAIKNSNANISLAITGVAGPEGGSLNKPVGSCWFAWSSSVFDTQSQQQIFVGDRQLVRLQAILFSIKKLLQLIKFNYR